jgi:phosphomannomutase
MVSISGIRGIVGETLTPDVVVRYVSGFAEYCKRHGNSRIVVGRDGRITGTMINDVVLGTLVAKGIEVVSIGICPTPTVQLAVEGEHAGGGIAITASHNPMEWNGLKFIGSSGMFLDAAENKEFWDIAAASVPFERWSTIGSVRDESRWIQKHLDAVLALPNLSVESIVRRKFKVVLDCVNAAGGIIVPDLLKALGCTVIPMNTEVSGIFARTPEPIPENLGAVCDEVRRSGADIGIVVDPDVDRLVLINEKGEPYGEEYTITTAVDYVLRVPPLKSAAPAHVVINLSTTRAVEDLAKKYGASCVRTPVGEINVAKKMAALGAVVGGEGSGGVILPAVHLGRDAIVGIALILQALAKSGGTVSELKQSLPQYEIAKGKIPIKPGTADGVIATLAEEFKSTARINDEDGMRFDFDEHWIHLRKSNTEPIMRVIAEAPTMDRAKSVVEEITKKITALLK